MTTVHEYIVALTACVLDLDPSEIKSESLFTDLGVDSIRAIELVAVCEGVFGIEIDDDIDTLPVATVGDAVKVITDMRENAYKLPVLDQERIREIRGISGFYGLCSIITV